MRFSSEVNEDSLRLAVYWYTSVFFFLALTLPLWKRGYEISMKTAGRDNVTMDYTELFLELVYQTSTSSSFLFTKTLGILLLSNHLGFRIYVIHIALGIMEVLLANYAAQLKFCVMHQLMHEIKPLYHLTHIEHHVCKGVFPTTMGMGLWEDWTSGHGNFFCQSFAINPIPYLYLQMGYAGANLVIHTMWPSTQLLQWHTMHHTVLADVYNLNIPGPYDKEHSKSVAKLQERLEKTSPFIRHEALSDLASLVVMIFWGFVFHYGFGVGISTVDWSKHMSVEYL